MRHRRQPLALAPTSRLAALGAAVALAAASSAHAAVVELTQGGVAYVNVVAVNNSGEVAGVASFGAGDPNDTRRGFRWQNAGGFTSLPSLGPVAMACSSGCTSSTGTDINNAGVVVGSSTTSDPCFIVRGMIWTGATATPVDAFPAPPLVSPCTGNYRSEVAAINDAGSIAGTSSQTCGGNASTGAFVAGPGGSGQTLIPSACSASSGRPYDINGSGSVLMITTNPNSTFSARLYDPVSGLAPLLNLKPGAHGLNDSGVVVGEMTGQIGSAARYDNGTYTPLPPVAGYTKSFVSAISNTDASVGWSSGGPAGAPAQVATLWQGTTPVDLNSRVPASAGFQLGTALDISDNGQYVTGEIGPATQQTRGYRLTIDPALSASLTAGAIGTDDVFTVNLGLSNASDGAIGSLRFPSGTGIVLDGVAGGLALTALGAPLPGYSGSIAAGGTSSHSLSFEVTQPGSARLMTRVKGTDAAGLEQVADAGVRVDAQLRPMSKFELDSAIAGALGKLMDLVVDVRDREVARAAAMVRKRIAKGKGTKGLLTPTRFEKAMARQHGLPDNALSFMPDRLKSLIRRDAQHQFRSEKPGYAELSAIFLGEASAAFVTGLGKTVDKLAVEPALFWRDYIFQPTDGDRLKVNQQLAAMTREGLKTTGTFLGEAKHFYSSPAELEAAWAELPKVEAEFAKKLGEFEAKSEDRILAWDKLMKDKPREGMRQFARWLGEIEAEVAGNALEDLVQTKTLEGLSAFKKAYQVADKTDGLIDGARTTRRLAGAGGQTIAKNDVVSHKTIPGLGNMTPKQLDYISDTIKRLNTKFGIDIELQVRPVNGYSAQIKDGIGKVEAVPTKNLTPDDVIMGAPQEWLGQTAYYKPVKPKGFDKLGAPDKQRIELRYREKLEEFEVFHGARPDPTGKGAKVQKMLKPGGAEVRLGVAYKGKIELKATKKGNATLIEYSKLEVNGQPVFKGKPRPIVSDFDINALINKQTGGHLPAGIRGQVELEFMNAMSKAQHSGLIPFGFHAWTHSGFDLNSTDFRYVAKYMLMYASEKQALSFARHWAPKFFPELGKIADPRKYEREYRKAIEKILDGYTRGKHLVKITAEEAVFGPGVDPTIGIPLPK